MAAVVEQAEVDNKELDEVCCYAFLVTGYHEHDCPREGVEDDSST